MNLQEKITQLNHQFPKSFRDEFYIPKGKNGNSMTYLCGNSLGVQPKCVNSFIQNELIKWSEFGVEAHFEGTQPWMYFHHYSKTQIGKLVGAFENEVVMMNTLTVNLHLMLTSFYLPTEKKNKIIIESSAFSSDRFALESVVRNHGLNPDNVIIAVNPTTENGIINFQDICNLINENADELALVLLGGVNYYTGQYFDIENITKACHIANAKMGVDLAHAVGNVPLKLHDWEVDFAVWCSYKYLNAGPGGVGGAYVHEKHFKSNLPKLAGWWGHNEATRFLMNATKFDPTETVDGWQLSNAPIINLACLHASLSIFEKAGYDFVFEKGKAMSDLTYSLLSDKKFEKYFKIITPANQSERGNQISLFFYNNSDEVFQQLREKNILGDMRKPNVIRFAPVPLYNTFEEIVKLYNALEEILLMPA